MIEHIKLPNIIGDARILGSILRLHSTLAKNSTPVKKITVDWEKTKTILPAGHAILATITDLFVKSKVELEHKHLPKNLLNLNSVSKLIKSSKSGEFPNSDRYGTFSKDLLVKAKDSSIDPMLKDNFRQCFINIDDDLFYDTMVILNELMQNSVDHSSSERFYYYIGRIKNELHFGLLDSGISIPGRLQNDYNANDDIEYLMLSLKSGIGTRTIRRGGLGLDILKSVAKNNNARIVLLSRGAQYRKYFPTRRSQKNILRDFLKGTWWMLRFPWREKK